MCCSFAVALNATLNQSNAHHQYSVPFAPSSHKYGAKDLVGYGTNASKERVHGQQRRFRAWHWGKMILARFEEYLIAKVCEPGTDFKVKV